MRLAMYYTSMHGYILRAASATAGTGRFHGLYHAFVLLVHNAHLET